MPTHACGSAPHWAHCTHARCCRGLCCVSPSGFGQVELPLRRTAVLLGCLHATGFGTPHVIESWLPGTVFCYVDARSSHVGFPIVCVWSLPNSPGPGFRASPKRTPAYPSWFPRARCTLELVKTRTWTGNFVQRPQVGGAGHDRLRRKNQVVTANDDIS